MTANSSSPSPAASLSASTVSNATAASSVYSAHSEVPSPVCPPPLPGEPVQSWGFLRDAIRTDHIGSLCRTPSQLAAYNHWRGLVIPAYGSVGNYIIQERLKWTPKETAATGGDGSSGAGKGELLSFELKSEMPLQNEADYGILKNDWPYGLEKGIFHICVWLKTNLECEGPRGALTRESWQIVEDFMNKTFKQPMLEAEERLEVVRKGRDEYDEWDLSWESCTNAGGDGKRVIWFKNWIELQSVRGLDHVHVLLRDPAPELVQKWVK